MNKRIFYYVTGTNKHRRSIVPRRCYIILRYSIPFEVFTQFKKLGIMLHTVYSNSGSVHITIASTRYFNEKLYYETV